MSKFSFAARIFGLVSLILASPLAFAQDDGPGYPAAPVATEVPAVIAQAVVPKATPAAPAAPARRARDPITVIERGSIADPKEGDVCVYEVEEGVQKYQVTERVVQVTPGYSYGVTRSGGGSPEVFATRYARDGNPFNHWHAKYRQRFIYPAAVGNTWPLVETIPIHANGGTTHRDLVVRITEVGLTSAPGVDDPVRVIGVEIQGHFRAHNPGAVAVVMNGGVWEKIRYAPDIHCLVSYEIRIDRYMHQSIRLVGHHTAAAQ